MFPVRYKNLYCDFLAPLDAVDMLKTTSVDKLPNDLEGMEASMERLLALIDDVHKYVDDVVVTVTFSCLNLASFYGFCLLKSSYWVSFLGRTSTPG